MTKRDKGGGDRSGTLPARRDENFLGDVSERANAMVEADAARAVAEIQAAVVMAKRFPRDPKACIQEILTACERPGLAEIATYSFPKGKNPDGSDKQVTGPSIHLALEIARQWGNLECGLREIESGDGYSMIQAFCWDIQTNLRRVIAFKVRHWRDTKQGGYELTGARDIYEITANQGNRRLRSCILGVIPTDIVDMAVKQVHKTMNTKEQVTPEKIAAMVAAFADVGVTKDMLESKIGRKVDLMPAQTMIGLRKAYQSIKDGYSSISEHFPMPESVDVVTVDCVIDGCESEIPEKQWHTTARRLKLDIHKPRCMAHVAEASASANGTNEKAATAPPPPPPPTPPAAAPAGAPSQEDEAKAAELRQSLNEQAVDFSDREANAISKHCYAKLGKSLNDVLKSGTLEDLEVLTAYLKERE